MVRDAPFLKHAEVRHVTFASPPKTSFWRFQQKDERYLATIEAIWWLLRERLQSDQTKGAPVNVYQYDDLLWYYTFQYQLILGDYQVDPERVLNPRLSGEFRKEMQRTRDQSIQPQWSMKVSEFFENEGKNKPDR
jgi:hypothetical protein